MAEESVVTQSKAVIKLDERHLTAVSEADPKVGSRVRIVIFGTVTRAEKEAKERLDDMATKGELDIDISNIKMASNNDIAELFDDDISG